jgi:hypothetical protein
MTTLVTRRTLVTTAIASAAVRRHAYAADAIKIRMPLALTGPLGSVGQR